MVKQGLKNYLVNLKYFFTPLGTFFLGIILGLSIFIPGTINLIEKLGNRAAEILNSTNLDFNALKESLFASIKALDWTNLDNAIKSFFDYDWLSVTLNKALYALVGDFGSSANEISILIEETISDFLPLLVSLVFCSLLGLLGGFILTRMLVRKEIAKRGIGKLIFSTLLDAFLSVTLIAFSLWLIAVWRPSIFISSFISIFLFGLVALIEAYFIQSQGKIKFRKLVNLKNTSKLLLSNLLILLIGFLFVSLVSVIFNTIVGIFVGVSFIEISFVVINLNAEAYVRYVIENNIKM